MKHTPGPWVVVKSHPTNACAYVRAASADKGQDVATLYYCSEGSVIGSDGIWTEQPNRDANARLIAAAPDMLALLSDLTTAWDASRLGAVGHHAIIRRAHAIIARVEGGAV